MCVCTCTFMHSYERWVAFAARPPSNPTSVHLLLHESGRPKRPTAQYESLNRSPCTRTRRSFRGPICRYIPSLALRAGFILFVCFAIACEPEFRVAPLSSTVGPPSPGIRMSRCVLREAACSHSHVFLILHTSIFWPPSLTK